LEKELNLTLFPAQDAAFDAEIDGRAVATGRDTVTTEGREGAAPFAHGPRYTYTDSDGSTGHVHGRMASQISVAVRGDLLVWCAGMIAGTGLWQSPAEHAAGLRNASDNKQTSITLHLQVSARFRFAVRRTHRF
jgi:hypothetical protein